MVERPVISRLVLNNFRTHKELDLKLSRGMNVVFGDNNAGKTTLIRSLQFLAFGLTSSRERNLRRGSKSGSVRVEIETPTYGVCSVERKFSARTNVIEVEIGGDKRVLSSPTPDAIRSTITPMLRPLGLAPIPVRNSDDLWLQFGPPLFLVGDGPTRVTRVISALSYIDVYERARDISKRSRAMWEAPSKRLSAEVADAEVKLAAAKRELDRLAPLWYTADRLARELEELEERRQRLGDMVSRWGSLQRVSEMGDRAEDILMALQRAWSAYTEVRDSRDALHSLLTKLKKAREMDIDEAERVRSARLDYDRAKRDAMASGVCPLCGRSVQASSDDAGG